MIVWINHSHLPLISIDVFDFVRHFLSALWNSGVSTFHRLNHVTINGNAIRARAIHPKSRVSTFQGFGLVRFYCSPRVPLIFLTVEKIECENLDFLFCLFLFSYSFLSCITSNVYGVYEQSMHQTTALLSEIFLFFVRGACEWVMAPNMCCSGFSMYRIAVAFLYATCV